MCSTESAVWMASKCTQRSRIFTFLFLLLLFKFFVESKNRVFFLIGFLRLFWLFSPQMITLFLVVLCGTLCCASSNSNQDIIETLMDNGRWRFLNNNFLCILRITSVDWSCLSVSVIALVLVLRVRDGVGTTVNVSLTCGDAYKNQSVFWKKDGNKILAQILAQILAVLDTIMLGKTAHFTPLHLHLALCLCSKAWNSRLWRGTRSRSWWRRWTEETTRVTSVQAAITSTTPWSWSN